MHLWAAATWAALAAPALSHSHIPYIIVNGQMFRGFDAKASDRRTANPTVEVVAWSANNADDGFVAPDNYTSNDIICHRGAEPAIAHAPVRPGDTIHVQWNGWPHSHVGPALSYLARCEGNGTGCAGIDKADLRFFKIDDSAPVLLGGGANLAPVPPPGRWVSDVLIAANNSWQVRIPPGLAPGPYVLRHELIALHYAAKSNGAQNYPQCINLWVQDSSSSSSSSSSEDDGEGSAAAVSWGPGAVGYGQGVSPTAMYKKDDAGVLVNVSRALSTYKIPGPTLVSGAVPIPATAQRISLPTAWGTPVRVEGGSTTVPLPVTQTFVLRPRPT